MSAEQTQTRISASQAHLGGCLIFLILGLGISTWISRVPSIQQNLNLSMAGLGGVLFALPAGLIATMSIAGGVASRLGCRATMLIGYVLHALSLVSIGYAQTPFQLVVALFFFGGLTNVVTNASNANGVAVEARYGKSIMGSLHGTWSVTGFFGAAIGMYMIGAEVSPAKHFLCIAGVMIAILAVASRYLASDKPKLGEHTPFLPKPDRLLLKLGLIMASVMLCEGTMYDWAGIYFKDVIKADQQWLGAGYTVFMCAMASTRLVSDFVTRRVGLRLVIQGSALITVGGYLLAIAFPSLATGILAYVLIGIGIASGVPLICSVTGRVRSDSAPMALAVVTSIGYFGFLAGPPILGMIASVSSLRISFLIPIFMSIVVILLTARTPEIK